jgi:hypothetical protein
MRQSVLSQKLLKQGRQCSQPALIYNSVFDPLIDRSQDGTPRRGRYSETCSNLRSK